MRIFKNGDRVIIYRKDGSWFGGRDTDKDRAIKTKEVLTCTGYEHTESGRKVTQTNDPYGGQLSVWTDCLKPANIAKITIII
jgi:hypothetical protein